MNHCKKEKLLKRQISNGTYLLQITVKLISNLMVLENIVAGVFVANKLSASNFYG